MCFRASLHVFYIYIYICVCAWLNVPRLFYAVRLCFYVSLCASICADVELSVGCACCYVSCYVFLCVSCVSICVGSFRASLSSILYPQIWTCF